MSYILTGTVSLAVAILAFLLQSVIKENRQLKKEKEEKLNERQTALENGVVCLLRVKLIEYHTKYMKMGCIASYALQNWLLMYNAYKSLGGNGMIDHMKVEIEELHIEQH